MIQWSRHSRPKDLSIIQNAPLIKKMAVPMEIFPLAGVLLSVIDLVVTSSLLVLLTIWYDFALNASLLWLPLLLAMLATVALGLGMGVTAVGVYRRDVMRMLPFLTQIWMLISPIMYPLTAVPERWRWLYDLNPMVGILQGIRAIFLEGSAPDPGLTASALVGTVLIFLAGWLMFRPLSRYFVDAL